MGKSSYLDDQSGVPRMGRKEDITIAITPGYLATEMGATSIINNEGKANTILVKIPSGRGRHQGGGADVFLANVASGHIPGTILDGDSEQNGRQQEVWRQAMLDDLYVKAGNRSMGLSTCMRDTFWLEEEGHRW